MRSVPERSSINHIKLNQSNPNEANDAISLSTSNNSSCSENDSSSSDEADVDYNKLKSKYLRLSSDDSNLDIEFDDKRMATEQQQQPQPKKRIGKQRLPTRRPNPQISNRNVLMARENRRKKKEYLEKLETKVQQLHEANKYYKVILQQQKKSIKKLMKNVSYLNGKLANKPEILELETTLHNSSTHFQPIDLSQQTEKETRMLSQNCENTLHFINNNKKQDFISATTTTTINTISKMLSTSSTGDSTVTSTFTEPESIDYKKNGTLNKNNNNNEWIINDPILWSTLIDTPFISTDLNSTAFNSINTLNEIVSLNDWDRLLNDMDTLGDDNNNNKNNNNNMDINEINHNNSYYDVDDDEGERHDLHEDDDYFHEDECDDFNDKMDNTFLNRVNAEEDHCYYNKKKTNYLESTFMFEKIKDHVKFKSCNRKSQSRSSENQNEYVLH